MLLHKLCSLLSASLILLSIPAQAQSVAPWEHQATGRTTVAKLGTIHYMVGYSNAGFDHFNSEIVVRWNDHGEQEQTLYEGIYDKPPAKVWGAGPHICIAMQACARYSDHCSQQVIAYRYESRNKAFAELKSARGLCSAPR